MPKAIETPSRATGGPAWVDRLPADSVAAKRERLGTALHELATELARERRRNADLERENSTLRRLLDAQR